MEGYRISWLERLLAAEGRPTLPPKLAIEDNDDDDNEDDDAGGSKLEEKQATPVPSSMLIGRVVGA